MAVQSEIEREPAAAEPRVLHAVVEDKLQRTGRMELRRRLLEAIVDGRNSVSWELKDGRLYSPNFRKGVDLQYPSPDEDWPSDGPRCLFDLWSNDVRYLAGLPPTGRQASGALSFEIEGHVISVRAAYLHADDTERVELHWDEAPPPVQEAASWAIQWHEQYRYGHSPISPFAEAEAQSPLPKRRSTFRGFLPAICVAALSGLGAVPALASFPWPIVAGSIFWGLVAVPFIGWFALNRLTASPDSAEPSSDASTDHEPRQRRWSIGFLVFTAVFVSLLLLPAAAAGIWLREPEAVSLFMATFFGLMLFLWGGILFYRPRREPDLEPL